MGRDVSRYVVDGVRVPSVTEVLHLAGFSDFAAIPHDVLEHARIRGQEVHQWIELLEYGEDVAPSEPEVIGRVEAYQAFRDAEVFKLQGSEVPMVHRLHRYAGTIDLLGEVNGALSVIDIKPPWDFQPAWPLQLAGYADLVRLETGKAWVQRFVLQLRGDGTYRLTPCTDREDHHDFLAALRCLHFKLRKGLCAL